MARDGWTSDDPVICIVGLDPLRKLKDFDDQKWLTSVSVGTPYAMHCRELFRGRTSAYRGVFEQLEKDGFRVYLTDLFKLFLSQPKGEKKYKFPDVDIAFFQELLVEEISVLRPVRVICFGREASSHVAEALVPKDFFIRLPHPSPSAGGTFKRLNVSNKPNDKAAYLISRLKKWLN